MLPRTLRWPTWDALIEGHTDAVWGRAFSPNGRLLATISDDGTARLWNMVSGQKLAHAVLEGNVLAVAAHPHQPLFGAGDASGRVHLLHVGFAHQPR